MLTASATQGMQNSPLKVASLAPPYYAVGIGFLLGRLMPNGLGLLRGSRDRTPIRGKSVNSFSAGPLLPGSVGLPGLHTADAALRTERERTASVQFLRGHHKQILL